MDFSAAFFWQITLAASASKICKLGAEAHVHKRRIIVQVAGMVSPYFVAEEEYKANYAAGKWFLLVSLFSLLSLWSPTKAAEKQKMQEEPEMRSTSHVC